MKIVLIIRLIAETVLAEPKARRLFLRFADLISNTFSKSRMELLESSLITFFETQLYS